MAVTEQNTMIVKSAFFTNYNGGVIYINKSDYEYYVESIGKTVPIEFIISIEKINELLGEISGFSNVKECKYVKYNDVIEISKTGSLIVGLLAMIFKDNEGKEATVYAALLTTISNNILAIVKLITSGFDYQVGTLLRSTYELYFTLLNVMLDNKKCKLYFDSARLNNENKIWKNYFNFKNLNDTISKYENKICNNNELSFCRAWRKNSYSYYSQFIHNSMFRCYSNSHTHAESTLGDEELKYNLWGGEVTRIEMYLSQLNDLIFWGNNLIIYIIGDGDYKHIKELILKYKERYREVIVLNLFYKEMIYKYKNIK